MGLLLAQYEYQRAKQRVNVLEAKGLRLNNLQERYSKRIAKIEKQYGKKQSQIESKYSQMSSMLSSQISQMASAGQVANLSIFANYGINPAQDVQNMYNQICTTKSAGLQNGEELSTVTQQNAWQTACSSVANQMTSLLQTILTDMKDAEKEMLEMEEEQLMEPLTEKDNEIQSDIATNETLLSFQKERRDAAKEAVQDAVKNSVAHFGLGG